MPPDPLQHELAALLGASDATAEFKAAVAAYLVGRPAAALSFRRVLPRLKVLRLLAQLLHAQPTLRIAQVHVDATSGCADLRGVVTARTDDQQMRRWAFRWDCRWRAAMEGWDDEWGVSDQMRAAREFGWRCFASWEPVAVEDAEGAPNLFARSAVEQRT